MSETNGFAKKKNIYLEAIIIIIGLLIMPTFLKWFFYKLFQINKATGDILLQSKLFAYICTVVLDFLFIFTGVFSEAAEIAKKRLSLVLSTIFIVDLKSTSKTWLVSLKYDGGFVAIYFGIILYQIITFIILLKQYFA